MSASNLKGVVMGTFTYNGDSYPKPEGWQDLSIEDWFYKLESVRDRMMNADELDLEPMFDEDGDELDPEEVVLIREYGFQDGGHWEAFKNWGVANWAAETGETPTDVEFRMGGIARERIMAEKAQELSGADGGIDPVEGVDLNTWAKIQASIAGGGNLDELIRQAGMDRPKWDRVSAEWMTRMQSDTTGAITAAYGNAFAGAGQGQFSSQAAHAAEAGIAGELDEEPVPFEKYVEIQEAMNAASNRGEDPEELLQSFGITTVDWSNIGMFWSKKMQQEMTKYHALFTEYSEKYRAKYSS